MVGLGGCAPGLRPRPNTPGTHRAWKTCAPPRLEHLRFLTETLGGLAVRRIVLAAGRLVRLSTPPAFGLDHGTRQVYALLLLRRANWVVDTKTKNRSWAPNDVKDNL